MDVTIGGIYLNKPIKLKRIKSGNDDFVEYGLAEMQGWRSTQEDAHNCILNFTASSSLFAIYDGHGGTEISQLASQNLPHLIKNCSYWKENDIENSLVHSFLHFDQSLLSGFDLYPQNDSESSSYPCCSSNALAGRQLRDEASACRKVESGNEIVVAKKKVSFMGTSLIQRLRSILNTFDDSEESKCSSFSNKTHAASVAGNGKKPRPAAIGSGSTACVLIIKDRKLYVANIGDSRCVLCRNGVAVDLSIDHRPENTLERRRIELAGGFLDKLNRVNGALSLSRSFGDHLFKRNPLLPCDQQIITAYPDVRTESLHETDRFVILACDGIWNSLTSQEQVSLASQRLSKGLTPTQVCEEVCDLCLSHASKGSDDTGYCHNGLNPNSASLSSCFLAFSDNAINPTFQSCGGISNADDGSYTSQVVLAAKNLSKTVSEIGVSLATSLAGVGQKPKQHAATPKKSDSKEKIEGVVTVIHVDRIRGKEFDTQLSTDGAGILYHFLANIEEPVTSLKFNPNGSLLLTCGPSGQRFNIFQILTHPSSSCLSAVQHLYVLQRGSTVAKILNISFSVDSRWVAVSTGNGTTHVFPITPYGGLVNVRTHTGPRVVNRESRFHRSAGLDSLDSGPFVSPALPNALYSPLKPREQHPSTTHSFHSSLYRAASNPRLPPYTPPLTVLAASKIKQAPSSLFVGTNETAVSTPLTAAPSSAVQASSSTSRRRTSSAMAPDLPYRRLASFFAAGRSLGFGLSTSTAQGGQPRTDLCPDSLYILRCNGQLNEYQLSVKPFSIGSRVCEENSIELHVIPTVEWPLSRFKPEPDTCLPLTDDHLILQAARIKRCLEKYSKEPKNTPPNRDLWISQVEMVAYNGPHRRLWMGPQFTFKTYLDSQRSASLVYPTLPGGIGSCRSEPISIGPKAPPFGSSTHSVPVIVEASSVGSFDQHQHLSNAVQLLDVCGGVWSSDNDLVDEAHGGLRRCIAEAMLDQRAVSPDENAATGAGNLNRWFLCSVSSSLSNYVPTYWRPV